MARRNMKAAVADKANTSPTPRDAADRWVTFVTEGFEKITDLELATLKIHIVTEGALRYLLAARLGVTEDSLEKRLSKANFLSFALLLELALAGLSDSHLLGGLRALNNARNLLAHTVEDTAKLHNDLTVFVREIGYRKKTKIDWPTTLPEQLHALRDALYDSGLAIFELAEHIIASRSE